MAQKLRKSRWSFKEERRLLQLAADSRSLEEVAEQMRRSSVAVRARAVQLGISFKPGITGPKGRKSTTTAGLGLRASMAAICPRAKGK
jgi:hypothetical protein